MHRLLFLIAVGLACGWAWAVPAFELEAPLKTVQAVGQRGEGHVAAAQAWRQLSQAEPEQLPTLLAALDTSTPLAANWIRGAVDAVAERQVQAGGKLPTSALEEFVLETRHSPKARRLAFEWLARVDPTATDRLVPGFLDDPSTEFRRDAVARLLPEAAALASDGKKELAVKLYRKALSGARDTDQVQQIADALGKLDEKVDLPKHLGFLMKWKLIGPFDDTAEKGFDVAYPPESEVNLSASYRGKKGIDVRWIDHETTDNYGRVDLNTALGKANGVAAYALAEFVSDREQPVELRMECICANKLWLNGQLVFSNKVYHSGSKMDQYVGRGVLKPGKNLILLKICQNEQTENWAQEWDFHFRVCDATGTAILSQDRAK